MKLKQQITLFALLGLLIPSVLISSFSIYKFKSKAEADIQAYEESETSKLKLYLKHITDVAYGLIDTRYQQTKADTSGNLDVVMQNALADLAAIRFDRGEGYFWVTDNTLPYPTMLMHAEKPKLKGKVLNDPAFNVEKHHLRNIYQVRAELANQNGDAFVDYIMKKPGSREVANKVSYSILHPELKWIVSAGFYTDQIAEAVNAKKVGLNHQINNIIITIIAITLVIVVTGVSASLYFSGKLSRAIVLIGGRLKSLAQGHQVDELHMRRKDEVGDMTASLNALVAGLRSYTAFANDIGQGNLTRAFTPLSAGDVLGNELLQMRTNLKTASDEKNIRDWVNEGLAKLGDVLRKNNNNTVSLANEVLKALVAYLKANQGGLFLLHAAQENEPACLELIAMYAYERKRYLTKKVAMGEGLLGQVALERQTRYVRRLPENYIAITSGLGGAEPAYLLIVPLIHDQTVYGAIEMASFKDLQKHEIQFVEKLAESMASTIATVQGNEKTRELLEHSQLMSENMKAQEEELRQNQEELQATQEQMQRRQQELEHENKSLREQLKHTAVDSKEAA